MSDFLRERADFLRVEIAGSPDAWDVVLRIDGTYFGAESVNLLGWEDWGSPKGMAEHFAAWLSEELGVEIPVGPPSTGRRPLWSEEAAT